MSIIEGSISVLFLDFLSFCEELFWFGNSDLDGTCFVDGSK